MTQPDDPDAAAPRLGRKRDASRDAVILDAAIEVLAEVGYDGMTIDMVAARAKAGKATLYRRWESKSELVLDAVACLKNADIDLGALPDTGTLRGDLVAMIKPHSIEDAKRKLQIMGGLVSMLTRHPELVDVAQEVIVEPRLRINRVLLRRAIERGEARPDCDVERIAMVSASMVAHRTLLQRRPVDRAFLISVIDGVVLPAAGISAPVPASAPH